MNQSLEPTISARAARIILAVAVCGFVAQGWFFAGAQLVWHEELATHALPPPLRLVLEGGTARVEAVCDGRSWTAFSDDRPQLVLCAAGLAWPILVTPYISALHYWPLQLLRPIHHGDPVALRRIALSFGVLGLLVLFAVVERIGDSLRAAISVAVAAVLPAVVMIHSVLVQSEIVPPLLIACAALIVARRPDPGAPPSPLRMTAAGALTGLAVLANVKGAVIALPLLAFALFQSPALRRTSGRAWLAAGVAAIVAVSPLAIAAFADPQARFAFEVSRRTGIAATRLDPRLLVGETFNAILFAVDLPFYFDIASGGDGSLVPATLLIGGLAFVYSSAELVRALRRLSHDRIAAACGALQLFYVVFVWLAYNQTPATNYGPVIFAQAVSIGCTVVAGSRLAARWTGRPTLGLVLLGVVAFASLVGNLYRRGDPRDFETLAMNMQAVRELGGHLERHPGGMVVVTNYNLAEIPDVLTGRPSLRIDRALDQCKPEADVESCERHVVEAVIQAVPEARFLVSLRAGVVDKGSAARAASTVGKAARGLGVQVWEEGRFRTGRGVEVLGLLAVERDRDEPPPSR